MTPVEIFRTSLKGLTTNSLRSLLTILGILIGIASVVILVAVGTGSTHAVQKNIQALGTNTITVSAGSTGSRALASASRSKALTTKDLSAITDASTTPDVKDAAAVYNATSATITQNGYSTSTATVSGTTPNWFTIKDWQLAAGNLFTNSQYDAHARVVVLGQSVVDSLFPGQDPIDQQVTISGTDYTVIGVLKSKGTNGTSDQDDIAVMPASTITDSLVSKTTGFSSIVAQATSSKTTTAANTEILNDLLTTHAVSSTSALGLRVLNQSELLTTTAANNSVFTVLLSSVAAISLLVGGIGVMNIMLVSVTERTREIGIRQALGARSHDLLAQFLTEATLLALIGGLLGVGVGLVGSHFTIVGVKPIVAPWSVFLALGVSAMVGIFFGLYPAYRASRLNPITALRYE